ncbi:hypothetical protein [Streptomyces sp. NPDC051286]|uniref:hypothetical protein n=1 Tax=Streptomyces sp. NPDC051286 TaxID=3365647 RepID=UPI0037BB9C73
MRETIPRPDDPAGRHPLVAAARPRAGRGRPGDGIGAPGADRLLDRLGWAFVQELGSLDPTYRSLVASMATLVRLGHPCDIEYATEQARRMEQVAVRDLDMMESCPAGAEQVVMAVASVVLYEPLSLRRPAQE